MAKILIIEDTENNRVLLTRRLKPRGYDIITAEDAEKGLLLVEGERPRDEALRQKARAFDFLFAVDVGEFRL